MRDGSTVHQFPNAAVITHPWGVQPRLVDLQKRRAYRIEKPRIVWDLGRWFCIGQHNDIVGMGDSKLAAYENWLGYRRYA